MDGYKAPRDWPQQREPETRTIEGGTFKLKDGMRGEVKIIFPHGGEPMAYQRITTGWLSRLLTPWRRQ
jgi:hypothetical protein